MQPIISIVIKVSKSRGPGKRHEAWSFGEPLRTTHKARGESHEETRRKSSGSHGRKQRHRAGDGQAFARRRGARNHRGPKQKDAGRSRENDRKWGSGGACARIRCLGYGPALCDAVVETGRE